MNRLKAAWLAYCNPSLIQSPEETAEDLMQIRRIEWALARRHVSNRLRAMAAELDDAAGKQE